MSYRVRIYDDVTIVPAVDVTRLDTNQKIKFIDQMAGGIKSLFITVAATHAGKITRNYTFYLPTKMKKGAALLVSREDGGLSAYPAPILINHNRFNENADPIGRVRTAEYIDTSNSLLNTPVASVIRDFHENRPFYQFVDIVEVLMDSKVIYDPNYRGMGFLKSTGEITDPEAIAKILDKRYLTVSAAADTDRAVCSICREDWAEKGEPCEHKLGEWYDEKKCFLIGGELLYKEWSFVNRPADSEAVVLTIDGPTNDSRTFSSSVVSDSNPYEVGIGIHFIDGFDLEGGRHMDRQEMVAKLKTSFADAANKFDLLDSTVSDETVSEVLKRVNEGLSLQDALDALGIKDAPPPQEPPPAIVPAPIAPVVEEEVFDFDKVMEKMLGDGTITEEEADKLYELMAAEIDTLVSDGIKVTDAINGIVNLADAKLSTTQRKKMSSSTFCGPERSFPVNDCAHYTAALRLIGRYKGPGDKSSIRACIERKGRAMGCGSSKEDAQIVQPDLSKLTDVELRKAYLSVEGEMTTRKLFDAAIPCDTCTEKDKQISVLTEQKTEIGNTVKALRDELKERDDELSHTLDGLSDAVVSRRSMLSFVVSVLNRLEKKDATFADLLPLNDGKATRELEIDYKRLRDSIDFDKINYVVGSAPVSSDPIPDPTTPIQDVHNASGNEKNKWVGKIVGHYRDLLKTKGERAAEGYIGKVKQLKLIDGDFNINDHLTDGE